jgi:hypothetical protein
MLCQVRTYQIRDGAMDEFVALFRDYVVPAREALGFTVLGVWNDPEDGTFVWVVGHDAPDGWEAIEAAYYASPERAALPTDPRELVASAETRVLHPVPMQR